MNSGKVTDGTAAIIRVGFRKKVIGKYIIQQIHVSDQVICLKEVCFGHNGKLRIFFTYGIISSSRDEVKFVLLSLEEDILHVVL